MSYAITGQLNPVQLQQPKNTNGTVTQVLALGSGGTLGADNGATVDLSGLPATSTLVSYADALTATASGTQSTGYAITAEISRFTTVATNGDAATLPVSVPGTQLTIINANASHSMQIFPNAGGTGSEQINALGANAALSLAATKVAMFYCTVSGQWHTILTA